MPAGVARRTELLPAHRQPRSPHHPDHRRRRGQRFGCDSKLPTRRSHLYRGYRLCRSRGPTEPNGRNQRWTLLAYPQRSRPGQRPGRHASQMGPACLERADTKRRRRRVSFAQVLGCLARCSQYVLRQARRSDGRHSGARMASWSRRAHRSHHAGGGRGRGCLPSLGSQPTAGPGRPLSGWESHTTRVGETVRKRASFMPIHRLHSRGQSRESQHRARDAQDYAAGGTDDAEEKRHRLEGRSLDEVYARSGKQADAVSTSPGAARTADDAVPGRGFLRMRNARSGL
mgnify:CR=1 FL=1